MVDDLDGMVQQITSQISNLPLSDKVAALNKVRRALHAISPFRGEPVDLVEWLPASTIKANDYNPNKIAPPEMRLLETSILADGYTQPVVTHDHIVVDGYHRSRVGKESKEVSKRVHGYLPCVTIRAEQGEVEKRKASTVRHNRARGTHGVVPMTEIVTDLHKHGHTSEEISKELGMDREEVLTFLQVGGLKALYSEKEMSEAWEPA